MRCIERCSSSSSWCDPAGAQSPSNDDQPIPRIDEAGAQSHSDGIVRHFTGKPPPLAASGSHEGCRTSEGVYDLNGNLSEWVSDGYQGAPEPFNRSATPDPATWRVLRGGTMWNLTFYGQECLSRHGHEVTFLNMDDGFRCCADASPSGSGPSKRR